MGLRPHHLVRLAAATTLLTFVLILLGVYTAATGTGLSCAAQWPTCGGGPFGLFPPNAASIPEWTHRFVAMVAGFAILGTAAAAWRTDADRRTRVAATTAAVFLPVQVGLGAETVFTYTPVVQTAHHGTALLIFGALVATTLWSRDQNVTTSTPSVS
jgi:cytochrome c oxidase assembly protein subunit 15